MKSIELVPGGIFSDARGEIKFVNNFHFESVKRFYSIFHTDTHVIRAWQGHPNEQKWFYVVSGSFLVAGVGIDNWTTPSVELQAQTWVLEASKPQILHFPCGYANGLKALIPNSCIMVYSDFMLEESLKEKIRFDSNLWFNWQSYD